MYSVIHFVHSEISYKVTAKQNTDCKNNRCLLDMIMSYGHIVNKWI